MKMYALILGTAFVAFLTAAGVATAEETKATGTQQTTQQAADKFTDDSVVKGHLKNHVKYPATKAQLLESCNKLADVAPADRQLFAKKLPEGTYKTSDDVIKAIGL